MSLKRFKRPKLLDKIEAKGEAAKTAKVNPKVAVSSRKTKNE